jgi:hypothetical protein
MGISDIAVALQIHSFFKASQDIVIPHHFVIGHAQATDGLRLPLKHMLEVCAAASSTDPP